MRWGVFIGALSLMIGCQAESSVPCGDLVCPAEQACAPRAERCALRELVDACEGRDDGDPCEAEGLSDGFCELGICEPASCGNGELDDGEICDDGNRDSGDGCSANCASNEICGNGIVDEAAGETCDEGDRVAGDGCSAMCLVEGCGNGLVEPERGELCDDGNTESGDGCRADCAKVELCGDALVDEGEECDDGNDNPADACHSCKSVEFSAEVLLGQVADLTEVKLSAPRGLAVDRSGFLYVADTDHHRVLRMDLNTGAIRRVAGTGEPGYTGEDLPGVVSALDAPHGVAVDGFGSAFIADTNNFRVRRLDGLTGRLVTIAGTGVQAPAETASSGPAVQVDLAGPYGIVASRMGGVVVTEPSAHRVLSISPEGLLSNLLGDGDPSGDPDDGLSFFASVAAPTGLATDSDSVLYIGDSGNHRLRTLEGSTIDTLAGQGSYSVPQPGNTGNGGPAEDATIDAPDGIAIDSMGNVYFADSARHVVRRIDGETKTIDVAVGTGSVGSEGDGGPALEANLNFPAAVAFDPDDNLYILEHGGEVVRRVGAKSGRIKTLLGGGEEDGDSFVSGAVGAQALSRGSDFSLLAMGQAGTILIRRDDSGGLSHAIGRSDDAAPVGKEAGRRGLDFGEVWGVAVDAEGGHVFLSETNAHRIHRVRMHDPDDESTWTIALLAGTGEEGHADGEAEGAQFSSPRGLFYADGVLYVADTGNQVIRAIDVSDGIGAATVTTPFGTPRTRGNLGDGGLASGALFNDPVALTRCENGDFFISDMGNHRVRRIRPNGKISTVIGDGVPSNAGEGEGASLFSIWEPQSLSCDAFGNLFVASRNVIRSLTADDEGRVTGNGWVRNIYGGNLEAGFPEAATQCLTGLQMLSPRSFQIVDACSGLILEVRR